MDNNVLIHHGILGMKWGVRRYQNYDGSYTKEGMRRYRKSLENYEEQKTKLQNAKLNGDKETIRLAKGELKVAKRKLNKNYDQLYKDKLADKGKTLYQKGKTIKDNEVKNNSLAAGVILGSSAVAIPFIKKYYGATTTSDLLISGIGAGSVLASAFLSTKIGIENKRLRAYYSHSKR